MDLVNHTGFHVQDFAGIDQHDQQFHVVALRQTLEWGDDVQLRYAVHQEPLCESDTYWGLAHASSVRQESDYCHYKPRCDVIVNATAFAPSGTAAPSFTVRLQVRMPDKAPILPARPQGLNQFMSPSPEALRQWLESLPAGPVRGDILIDKELRVCGPREFRRRSALVRCLASLGKLATFGVMRASTWRLTQPAPVVSVPLRPEFGFGGECRVYASDLAAQRVPLAHRLSEAQTNAFALVDEPFGRTTIASSLFNANPLGRGFAQPWFLKATRAKKIPAHQIERPAAPVTAADFQSCLEDKVGDEFAVRLSGGFGVRLKSHPQRRRLAGTIDDAFVASERWLPDDFDFAVWNVAEPDQQTHFLQGGEVIELTNVCPAEAQGTARDAAGNTTLTLKLPENECYLLIRLDSGEMFASPMAIDTVIVEPDERRLSLVWRAILAKADDIPVRAVDVLIRTHAERDAQRIWFEALKASAASAATAAASGAQVGGRDG
jgi:hypothetical protein